MVEWERREKAYAKINLGLNILRRREDGYHEIESVFQQIDLCDAIRISPISHGIEIICSHPDVPCDASNICHKAVRLLQAQTGRNEGIRIELNKKIPVGAGLGGGSSDAAAVLKALNQQWDLGLAQDALRSLARQLGADVPFFLSGRTMFAQGIGDILSPVNLMLDFIILIVFPKFSVSTVWAYKNYKINLTNSKKNITLADLFLADLDLLDLTNYLKNDLEQVVFERHPQLNSIKSKLYAMGAFYASMSGSGSSVFGLFFPDISFSEDVEALFGFDCDVFISKPLK
jgi:4-diphosphocytidyl-2-C-methyl-D-erythritol kinase